jgi:hypothetical protein
MKRGSLAALIPCPLSPSMNSNVRAGQKADMCSAQADVRFTPIVDIQVAQILTLLDHLVGGNPF